MCDNLQRRGLENKVRKHNKESTEFTKSDLKHSCVLNPLSFSRSLDDAIKEFRSVEGKNWKIKSITIHELIFADDMALISHIVEILQRNVII